MLSGKRISADQCKSLKILSGSKILLGSEMPIGIVPGTHLLHKCCSERCSLLKWSLERFTVKMVVGIETFTVVRMAKF
jgi:hypothetical protein